MKKIILIAAITIASLLNGYHFKFKEESEAQIEAQSAPVSSSAVAQKAQNIQQETGPIAVKQSITKAGITEKAGQVLVATQNIVCAEGDNTCNAGQTVTQKAGPITEEAIRDRNYASYIPFFQRIGGGEWTQVGFIANKTTPAEKLGNKGVIEINVFPNGKAGIIRGTTAVILDFSK